MTLATFAQKINATLQECVKNGLDPNIVPVYFFAEDEHADLTYYTNGGTTTGNPHLETDDGITSVVMWIIETYY